MRVADQLVVLQFEGSDLRVTPEHPVWVVDLGWVPARDIVPGDKLLNPDGEFVTVHGTCAETETTLVGNLSVSGSHTFYAGRAAVLVHNSCVHNGIRFKMVGEGRLRRLFGEGGHAIKRGEGYDGGNFDILVNEPSGQFIFGSKLRGGKGHEFVDGPWPIRD